MIDIAAQTSKNAFPEVIINSTMVIKKAESGITLIDASDIDNIHDLRFKDCYIEFQGPNELPILSIDFTEQLTSNNLQIWKGAKKLRERIYSVEAILIHDIFIYKYLYELLNESFAELILRIRIDSLVKQDYASIELEEEYIMERKLF